MLDNKEQFCNTLYVPLCGIFTDMERGSKRPLVDTHTDTFMQYTDAKLAAALCKVVPAKYALKYESGLSGDWLL